MPEGRTFWEIGTSKKAGEKATSDYNALTDATPDVVRHESTFVFVTPLSGVRDWECTWKKDAQLEWLETRRKRNEWKDIRIIDGTGIIDWLHYFPAVELWLAEKNRLPAKQMQTPEQRWNELKTFGSPPALIPLVFLMNRNKACEELEKVFSGATSQLKIESRSPDQVADFVSAYLANKGEDAKVEVISRCLIISGVDGWNAMTTLRDRHILVADFDLDDADLTATRLLEKARRAGHAVVFSGYGGIPYINQVGMPNPKSHQLKEALEKAGYNDERARNISNKTDGSLSSLLRLLQRISLTPEWVEETNAAELTIAEIIGRWRDDSEADRGVVEKLSKKAYGEWIGKIRDIALRPGTPLIQRDGAWKVVARYEGWYTLGPRIFDEHLDRLREVAVNVLRERDPQFDLSPDERYLASIRGKILGHSRLLRKGIAEGLALIGSHPQALSSCSFGKAEATAILSVREILEGADWVLWASLNDLLPLLAEAAPKEFLNAVEKALNSDPCPFDNVFAQERSAVGGQNYMTGLLWALETLAWDAQYLTSVVIILGEIAARDPGGNYMNRPDGSIATILLPWMPQTCAPLSKRRTAIETLMNELPNVAWKILLSLLPSSHQMSMGSRRPEWRDIIPDNWSSGVPRQEYWEQVDVYIELAINAAKQELSRLAELIDRLDDLPPPAQKQILNHLTSDAIVSMPEADRLKLWTKLFDMAAKHKKFADAKWAMKPKVVKQIAAVAEKLAPHSPIYRYRRLFGGTDFDLYEEKGNYEEQRRELEDKRRKAINEVFAVGGVKEVIEFAKSVEEPWIVGGSFGAIAADDIDGKILPELLESENKPLAQFAGSFVRGRFFKKGWSWVDGIDTSQWTPSQKGQLLAYLPFTSDAWERVARILEDDEAPYWTKTNANPERNSSGLEEAIERLVQHGRLHAAIGCLAWMRHNKQPLNCQQAIRVLLAAIGSSEGANAMSVHSIIDVIVALQEDPSASCGDLFRVEWAFLPLLDGHHGATPKVLEWKLAIDPAFFCEIIRIVFHSSKEEGGAEEFRDKKKNLAKNGYRLLHEWKTPPGSQEDGTFDGNALISWLKDVKAACTESGHLEVALITVGQVLTLVPTDPDGLWLHHSAAAALNEKDADELRKGFVNALISSRGVYCVDPEGREERELARKYQNQAEEIEARGYHRLASSLRGLASFYEHEAERETRRDALDD